MVELSQVEITVVELSQVEITVVESIDSCITCCVQESDGSSGAD